MSHITKMKRISTRRTIRTDLLLLVFIILMSMTGHMQAYAQTKSVTTSPTKPNPATRVDIAVYPTVDECLAVSMRLLDSLKKIDYVDTIPLRKEEIWKPLAPVVRDDVARCGAKFQVATTPIADWMLTMQMFTMAGREADVRAMVSLRLEAISASIAADRERVAVLDSVVQFYITQAIPRRIAAADTVMSLLANMSLASDPITERIKRAHLVMTESQRIRDSLTAKKYARQVVTLAESLSDADRKTEEFGESLGPMIFLAHDFLDGEAALDSLRQGRMAGFLALKLQNWKKSLGNLGWSFPAGRTAPMLQGRWFVPEGMPMPTSGMRPTLGSVALVVFFKEENYGDFRFANSFATLRRLKQQFPELEIDIVADHPSSYFGPLVTTDSVEEGNLFSRWLLDFHKIPGALVVEKSTFFRIDPREDRRMILLRAENPIAYRGDIGVQGTSMGHAEAYLVDRSGMIIEWILQGVDRTSEAHIAQLITALFHSSQSKSERR